MSIAGTVASGALHRAEDLSDDVLAASRGLSKVAKATEPVKLLVKSDYGWTVIMQMQKRKLRIVEEPG